MDAGLSDLLTCPRCGPTYGLVLLPYEVSDRRVRSGVLGCANCRERYVVEAGVADLRVGGGMPGDRPEAGASGPTGSDPESAVRLAGLMGLAEAVGVVLVAGPAAEAGPALSSLVAGVEVVVADGVERLSAPGVSRLRVNAVLPFRSGSLRGVALTGWWSSLLEEGARTLGREGRLVLDPAPEAAEERLVAVGLEVVAVEGGVVVAVRSP